MTRRLWRAAAAGARAVSWVLLRVTPPREHAVVHGWPDNEGNTVEVVRVLLRRYTGTSVVWLLDDTAYAGPRHAQDELRDPRLRRVAKRSPAALWLGLTAELTFFTHGLLTAVTPPPNRLVVNLWHGDGPKATRDTRMVRSTVVVAGTRLWGDYKGRTFRLPPAAVAVVGNPRIDQFAEALPPGAAGRLGLDPGRARVLWLPTYREARGPRAREWVDAEGLTRSAEVRALARAMHEAARELSLDLVVKPHPLDVDSYGDLGVGVLTGAQLDAAGVSLYQVMGSCDGLISDVSSAWVDFLTLDRPLGFYLPDLDRLREQRGLNVQELEDLLPGPLIRSVADAVAFLASVADGSRGARPSTFDGYARIGVRAGAGAADRLVSWLADYPRAGGRRPMFRPADEVRGAGDEHGEPAPAGRVGSGRPASAVGGSRLDGIGRRERDAGA